MNKKDREELEQIITLAIERAVLPDGKYNYYRATESLLENYVSLKQIASEFETYAEGIDVQKSKDIVSSQGSGYHKDRQEIKEEKRAAKLESFEKTQEQLRLIDAALDKLRGRERFKVIELYYFGIGIDGSIMLEKPTFAEIAEILGRDEKTIRRWRSKAVKDIAVLLFGIPAALSVNALTYVKKV